MESFPGGSVVKNLPTMQEMQVLSLDQEDLPWRRKWQPTPVFLPGKSHGQRSLVGYTPPGRKESDTTEQLYFTNTFFQEHASFVYEVISENRSSDNSVSYFQNSLF